jgi:hypothetical protein
VEGSRLSHSTNGFPVRERRRNRKRNPEAEGAPPLLRLLRPVPWTQGEGGGSTKRGDTPGFFVEKKRSVPPKGGDSCERNGSERAEVASVAEWNPPRARVLPLEAASPGGVPVGGRATVANDAWGPPSGASTGEAVASEPYKARMKSS